MDTNNKENQISIFDRNKNILKSIIVLALLLPIAYILIEIVSLFSDSRATTSIQAQDEIMKKWGTERVIQTPYLENAKKYILPTSFNADITTTSEVRYRGIHKCVVYFADITINAKYKIEIPGKFKLKTTNIKSVKNINVCVNGKNVDVKRATDHSYIEIITTKPNEELDFSMNVTVKGAKKISVVARGDENHIKISGNWNSPSFQGDFLPEKRSITKNGFTSTWEIKDNPMDSEVTVEMFIPLNAYALVERAVSYAFLFLIIYLFSLFMAEYISKKEVHIIQYLISSITAAMFYLLLLSISEHIAFGSAFLISATMSSGLTALYMGAVLKAKKVAISIFATNAVAYAMIYILLTRETFALLVGTLILFAILATIMALTTNLNQKEQ